MKRLRATFTVPIGTSHERVEKSKPNYARKWLDAMEKGGWKLKGDVLLSSTPLIEGDRLRYFLKASFVRGLQTQEIETESEEVIRLLVEKYGGKVK